MVKAAVGSTPAIMGTKIAHSYHKDNNVFEVGLLTKRWRIERGRRHPRQEVLTLRTRGSRVVTGLA